MKRQIASLVLSMGFAWIPFATLAQERQGCFMVGTDGEVIRLDSLCGGEVFQPGSSPETGTTSGAIQIPIIRRSGGIPVVEVVFNGGQSFEMLVDTGASGTVITQAMADALGVEPEGVALIDTANANQVEFELGLVEAMEAGGLMVRNVIVAIAPTLDIGLLGQDFYGEYDLTIRRDFVELSLRSP